MSRHKMAIIIVMLSIFFVVLAWQLVWFSDDRSATVLSGNVEIREVSLGFRVGGRVTAITVDEGDSITSGMVLARLDGRPFSDSLAIARADIDVATASLRRQENGSRPQEITQARAQLESARALAASSARDFLRLERLAGDGFFR